jgi:chromosome segregation ATPase
MKLGLLEQQMTEEKERHEEELDRLKDEIGDLRKQVNRVECDNMKMGSEMKTLDMNVTMKEESLKRTRAELEVLNDKNVRLMSTMELEAKNTSKITEEYVSLREENVKLQIALESSKKRSAMHEDELKRLKADQEFKSRHESGQAMILDTIQQLKQQMSERELQETVQLKSELETAKRESHVARERTEEIKKEAEESTSKASQQIDILNKQLEEEKSKCNTVQSELQRVKSRQMLGFTSADGKPTSPSRSSPLTNLELKQLTDEVRQLKTEIKTLESQRDEFKKISLDAEKRMNTAGEEYTKSNLIRDRELAKIKTDLANKIEVITKLETDISELKSNCGQEDINQLRVQYEGAQSELEGVKFQLTQRDSELVKAKAQYTEQLIEHGKAQEEAQTQ